MPNEGDWHADQEIRRCGAAAILEPFLPAKTPPSDRIGPVKRFLSGPVATALIVTLCMSSAPARAEVSVIRDAETEQLLRDYVTPIFHAAGINTRAARIVLVGDKSFNAFVADGQKIFINVGALLDAKTPNEIIGVLAHESGHIAGGHLAVRPPAGIPYPGSMP